MSAPREKFSRVMVWPATLLALAAALYVAAWSVPVYYALMPARFPFELRAGAEQAAEFRARLDTTYIVVLELERDLYMSSCLLGDPDVAQAQCSGVPAVLDLGWSVTSGGKVVASGDSSVRVRVPGSTWSFSSSPSRVIGRFDAAKGGSYRVRVESRKDGKMLNTAGPSVAIQADSLSVYRRHPGVFKAQITAVPWLQLAAVAVAAIGVLWSLGAAAQWYVRAPGARREPSGDEAVAAARRGRIARRTSYAFWIVAALAAAGPSLWEYAFFDALAPGVAADRATLEKSSRTLSLYRGDLLLKHYRVALGSDPADRDRPAGAAIEEGAYQARRGMHKRFGATLRLQRPDGDGAARTETSIHGPAPGHGFLARLHRLRDWTSGGIGLTSREIEELMRVVPQGTPLEVRP